MYNNPIFLVWAKDYLLNVFGLGVKGLLYKRNNLMHAVIFSLDKLKIYFSMTQWKLYEAFTCKEHNVITAAAITAQA